MSVSRVQSHTTTTLTRTRRLRRVRRRYSPVKYLGWTAALILSLSAAAIVCVLTLGYLQLVRDLPSIGALPVLLDGRNAQLQQPTRLYERNGIDAILSIQDPNSIGSEYLILEAIPTPVISTTLALNDPSFWAHAGWNLPGTDANPTLAEQLVEGLLLWNEPPGLQRDLRRSLLAAQATAQFGRRNILEWYLNSIPYGYGIVGVDAAAWAYFAHSASDLTLAEAAFLAAAAENPAIHPAHAVDLTIQRQTEILLDLYDRGWINAQQVLDATQAELALRQPEDIVSLAPAYTDLVLAQLSTQIPIDRIVRGGLKIITTLDLDLQSQTQCVVVNQLAYQHDGNSQDCEAARLLPTLPFAGQQPDQLDASAVILEPATGQILALTGERLPESGATHPAGTLMMPYVYLSAFARGFGPASLGWDIPDETDEITNLDGNYHGPVRLRMALANDYLMPAAQLYEQIGGSDIERTLDQFGIETSDFGEGGFNDLLDQRVSILGISHAMSPFANQGILAGQNLGSGISLKPVSILQVYDVGGQTWLDWSQPQQRPLVGNQLAYLINHVLRDETARWPSQGHPNPLEIGRPAAVKEGQTPSGGDTWIVGAIPQRLVGVWVGSPAEEEQVSPDYAAAIWHALIQYAGLDLPVETWSEPAGIVNLSVCDPSGLLPTVECPNIVNEIFLANNKPTRPDGLYRTRPVNRVTGLLATIFTPPSLVEERVYLIVPPVAAEWAKSAGLPIPPSDYDILGATVSSPTVNITSPQNLDQVNGEVTIQGTASGEDFDSYRLLVGAGLNPQRWLQIGESGSQPVEQDVLGIWDTTGLSGLYVIQLQVIRDDQQIETTIVQVTIDDQPPEISLLSPLDDQQITPSEDGYLVLQVEASDDLNLEKIEFQMDGSSVGILRPSAGMTPPFNLAWKSSPGQHHILIIASDGAGNTSQIEATFYVR